LSRTSSLTTSSTLPFLLEIPLEPLADPPIPIPVVLGLGEAVPFVGIDDELGRYAEGLQACQNS
jgi:hypothetical protein